MAQPNNNNSNSNNYSISFSISDSSCFDSQSSQVNNASFQQWTRSTGSVPSPSTPVRMAMTSPGPQLFSHSNMNRTNIPDSRIDPNLGLLAPPRSMENTTSNIDYMNAHLYSNSGLRAEPWSAVSMRTLNIGTGQSSNSHSPMGYRMYPSGGPGSDIDSGAPRSDSGYYTQQAQSIISNEPERLDQELPSEMFQLGNINVNSASSETTEVFPQPSDTKSQSSHLSASHGKATLQCHQCKEVSKCPSDLKKHMSKHDKPHKCDFPRCSRAASGKGFTTINDLMRHKKSVHHIGVEEGSYQCASENCRNKEKLWPRLDNFKQHITRMHRDEDEQDLIRRSAYQKPYQSPPEALGVAPMDTTLAGIDPEKQFAGNELDDPISAISLTQDQNSSQWDSFGPSSHRFAMDVDRTSATALGQDSTKADNNNLYPGPILSNHSNASISALNPAAKSYEAPLNLLADAASIQASPEHQNPSRRRQLSSAPQTKAQQQRQALEKLSKAIVGEMQNSPSDGLDLENVVLRVLYGVNAHNRNESSSSQPTMTKAEGLNAAQAISNIIKQSASAPFNSRPRRHAKGLSANMLKCEMCNATLPRSCDMKKHMKRHTRPYGCTYPKCHKRFGAKSDWKRHENSQHFQLEAFRCEEPCSPSQTICGELFYRAGLFKMHLHTSHQISQEELIQHRLRENKIGKNGQGQFWCGFCKKIVKLKEKRNAAWDERFDHIDAHFNKEKMKIDDWLCVEAKKKKGEVCREMDRTNFDDEDHDVCGAGSSDDSMPATAEDANQMLSPLHPVLPAASSPMPSSSSAQPSSRKRQAPPDTTPAPAPKHARRELSRYCCACEQGPWSTGLYANCITCQHRLCKNCPVVRSVDEFDSSMQLG